MNSKSHVAVPCGHQFSCGDCSSAIMARGQPCPMCRSPITMHEAAGSSAWHGHDDTAYRSLFCGGRREQSVLNSEKAKVPSSTGHLTGCAPYD
eukprot:3997481-Prymnesium_polylepis.1